MSTSYWQRRLRWNLDRLRPGRRSAWGAVAGLLLASGFSTLLPTGAVRWPAARLDPPWQYRVWWEETKRCSGLEGRFRRIIWYRADAGGAIETDDGPKVGLWFDGLLRSRIILAPEYVESELVVRHEMLHELLRTGDHPEEFFERRCRLTWETFDWPQTDRVRLSR